MKETLKRAAELLRIHAAELRISHALHPYIDLSTMEPEVLADFNEEMLVAYDLDAKVAGWWCWGACNWIGSGWCSGTGPWQHDGEKLVDARQLPHLGNAGQGRSAQGCWGLTPEITGAAKRLPVD